ncbi:hypothetical protein [Nocardia sp. NPDC024068]|uniref:hypothetical protein n=1 Tax=Nocardia sp. NPDC024068 TaxID=3157197 RepID=UPI0033C64147
MCRSDLVGEWSVETGYYSSMEDEFVVFFPDGVGSVEYARPFISNWVLFRWTHIRSNLVRITPYAAFTEEDHEFVAREIPQPEEARYRIVSESRPLLDSPVPVLYLEDCGLLRTGSGFGLVFAEPRDQWRWPNIPAGE